MVEPATGLTYASANHNKHTTTNWVYRKHLAIFYETLIETIGETGGRTLLDAGCGEGFVVGLLADAYPDLVMTGIDISESAIRYAQKCFGGKARFRVGSLYRLPFSDNSFDTVLCSEVLEHVDDPVRAMAEIKRVSRKHVVTSVPQEPYFRWLNLVGRFLKVSQDPGHVNFWTARTYEAFIRVHFPSPKFIRKQLYQIAVASV